MKILILSPYPQSVVNTISRYDDTYVTSTERLDSRWLVEENFDLIVSFGYRHIIKEDVLEIVGDRIVNLHIGYLPYGKGAHPNFWSHVENCPSGVTIHRIDPGIDTGRILVQKEVFVDPSIHSFSSSWKLLMGEIELLFDLNWWSIRKNEIAGVLQDPSRGSFHLYRDLEPMMKYLDLGWDTPIDECVRRIREDKVITDL